MKNVKNIKIAKDLIDFYLKKGMVDNIMLGNFLKRHKCNPGLTGWAQVNGLRGATPEPEIMKRRMEYDLWYLNNWTIYLDIYIIIKTFYALIKYKGD